MTILKFIYNTYLHLISTQQKYDMHTYTHMFIIFQISILYTHISLHTFTQLHTHTVAHTHNVYTVLLQAFMDNYRIW